MALCARRLPSLLRVLASPVPRSRQYYEGATTSHSRISGRLLVRCRSPRVLLRSCPPRRSREVGGRSRARAFVQPAAPNFRRALTWTRMGSLRSSGDPSRAFAAFQDPGRTDVSSPLMATLMLPPLSGRRRLRRWLISGLTRSFSTCCHTLHACRCRHTCKACFRPAGWAFTGRESNPLDRYERFQLFRPSSFPALLTLPDCAPLHPGYNAELRLASI